jgi:anti-sigma regulatory factor (Ser/Thr protein kinase)
MDTFTQEYPATPASVAAARAFVAAHFANQPDVQDDARLLASELAQNAVRHGDGARYGVTVERHTTEVRVYVTNSGDGGRVPEKTDADFTDTDAESGRGLGLVVTLAPRYGYQLTNRMAEVWFAFPTAA